MEDSSGNMLMESTAVLNRWSEHRSGLYNYELHPDTSLLQSSRSKILLVLREEVEETVHCLKEEKSPGVDSFSSELRKNGGEAKATVLTAICQKILETKEEWTQSLLIPVIKKCNLRQCQNYRTISPISHPSKRMLQVVLNRLKAKTEELLAEEQEI